MPKKLTNEQFKEKSIEVHGDRYNYDESNYINAHTKLKIICEPHGGFWQTPTSHLAGSGCPNCGRETMTAYSKSVIDKNKIEFIPKSIIVHGDKYDYHLVDYINSKTKVKITCKQHGEFEQTPCQHLEGHGCPQCGYNVISEALTLTLEEFIKKAILIHGHIYDYSNVNYVNAITKIIIICIIHGEFEQTPNSHLNGSGCPYCAIEKRAENCRGTTEDFVSKATLLYGNKYDYNLVEYVSTDTKVKIICRIHTNQFEQTPYHHLEGQEGCSDCSWKRVHFVANHFIDHPERSNIPSLLYCVHLTNEDLTESFLKIGITKKDSVYDRMEDITSYNCRDVFFTFYGPLETIATQEQRILKEFNHFKYIPSKKFNGHTECLSLEALPLLKEYQFHNLIKTQV